MGNLPTYPLTNLSNQTIHLFDTGTNDFRRTPKPSDVKPPRCCLILSEAVRKVKPRHILVTGRLPLFLSLSLFSIVLGSSFLSFPSPHHVQRRACLDL